MRSLTILAALLILPSCGEEEDKKSTSGGTVTIARADIKNWTKSVLTQNGTKQGETVRTLNDAGEPVRIEDFNAAGESIRVAVVEYNAENRATKITTTSGSVTTIVENTYDDSSRLVTSTTTTGDKVVVRTTNDYATFTVRQTFYDTTADTETVSSEAESVYALGEVSLDGSANFLLQVSGFSKAADNSSHSVTTSDCNASRASNFCQVINKNKLTDKLQSQFTTFHNVRQWDVEGQRIDRDLADRIEGRQYNEDGVETTYSLARYTYNDKYKIVSSITDTSFPTDLQLDFKETVTYTYDDTNFNIVTVSSRSETTEEGSQTVTTQVTEYTY